MSPQIAYPCIWIYAIIGLVENQMRSGILEVVGKREHKLTFSRWSANGKYLSFHLEMPVESQSDRDSIYQRLKNQPGVKMVL